MIYLFLAILCSSSIALVFKYSEGNKMNRYAVTSANYLTALTIGLLMIISKHSLNLYELNFSLGNFIVEFTNVLSQTNAHFSKSASFVWAILLGIMGAFSSFYHSFIIRKV